MTDATVPYTAWRLLEEPSPGPGVRSYRLGPLKILRGREDDRERLVIVRLDERRAATVDELKLVLARLWPTAAAPPPAFHAKASGDMLVALEALPDEAPGARAQLN